MNVNLVLGSRKNTPVTTTQLTRLGEVCSHRKQDSQKRLLQLLLRHPGRNYPDVQAYTRDHCRQDSSIR